MNHDIRNAPAVKEWCAIKINVFALFVALASFGGAAVTFNPQSGFAQSADPDDDDDNTTDPDDDSGVPDPDDGGGGSEPDSDAGTDPGTGDDATPDDSANDDSTSVGGTGSTGGTDDDGPADDDSGQAVASAATDTDDDGDDDSAAAPAAGIDSDDDNDATTTTTARAGDDDADDANDGGDAPVANDDDDAGDNDTSVTGGGEDDSDRIKLDARDGIETDREGFRYRRNEFVALDLDVGDVTRLRGRGYQVIRSDRLGALSGTLFLLKSPARIRDSDALEQIEAIADPAVLGLNHLFDSSSANVRRKPGRAPVKRASCGCQIGLIDTGVAAQLPMFKHATIEQRSFNTTAVTPRLHGTAIAHLFAGTSALPNRKTRIVVADIFSGPRSGSGSTYALVKALDWMAAKGVPVINISLSGPRNPVVASTLERMAKRGHLIVAAAGNDGPAAPPVFPGAYAGVVAVTAVDARQQIYRYANRGNYIDFSAYGVDIPSIDPRGVVTTATGTSFAAPIVAARLAAKLSRPDPNAARVLVTELVKKARDLGPRGRDGIFGHGLIETSE